ncbi:MAG: uroporphyrinogen-III synthase [Rhodospirillaceae bacterium]
MTRILVTRPWEDAEPLAARLGSMGHKVIIEPLLEIVYFDDSLPSLDGIKALLFTSANGVRAFERVSTNRTLSVFAVGAATAAAASSAGFARVSDAGGDVEALAGLVTAECVPADGPLLHIAASERAGDLSARLTATGFTLLRQVLYRAQPAAALSEATRDALTCGYIDAVVLFSPRTAQTLVGLLADDGLSDVCCGIVVVCLSTAVADAASRSPDGAPLRWRAVRVAARPELEALLAAVGE